MMVPLLLSHMRAYCRYDISCTVDISCSCLYLNNYKLNNKIIKWDLAKPGSAHMYAVNIL